MNRNTARRSHVLQLAVLSLVFMNFAQIIHYVINCCHRVLKNHSGAGVFHSFPHLLAHIFSVTVNWALFTSRFVFLKFAPVKALQGILIKFLTAAA
jgi:hypothetical protein